MVFRAACCLHATSRIVYIARGGLAQPVLKVPKTMRDSLGHRAFTMQDQAWFARLSGDNNPLHIDPIAARRTQAGVPVVHGLHTLLLCIDRFADRFPDLPPIGNVKIRFDLLLRLGETVKCIVTRVDSSGFRMEADIDGAVAFRLAAVFGEPRDIPAAPAPTTDDDILRPEQPQDLSFAEMEGRSGRVGFAAPPSEVAHAFPAAARQWGERRIAALLCTTRLVGMVCPGLHSIFGGLSLNFCRTDDGADVIRFRVSATDPRFRVVRHDISGGRTRRDGRELRAFPTNCAARHRGPGTSCHAERVQRCDGLGTGGSRGLGEVTAKLLAVGGAHVIGTYSSGQAEAERIRGEIGAWGGSCDILRYDVQAPAAEQLAYLTRSPTHLYYFATPPIFQQKSGFYVRDRFARFLDFYIDGFYTICQLLIMAANGKLSVFYPSSVAVESRPPDMTEYAMAKTAGEVLCADLNATWPNIRIVVNRIPRVLTDQTVSLVQVASADPLDVMLPIIRQVQAAV